MPEASQDELAPVPLAKAPVERPAPPPGAIAPPAHGEAEAQARFDQCHAAVGAEPPRTWELLETLAFELGVFVALDPDAGAPRPRVEPDPETGRRGVRLYTRESRLDAVLAGEPEDRRQRVFLSGAEALRWLWALPTPIDDVRLEAAEGPGGSLRFPAEWTLRVFYPHTHELPSLDAVASVGLSKLGRLPGARATRPEAIRALVQNWKRLIGVATDPGSTTTRVSLAGETHVPLFTDPEQFFAFTESQRIFQAKPQGTGPEPPFRGWLLALGSHVGVVLDPSGRWPLRIDAGELFFLDLWARGGGKAPGGPEVSAALEKHHREGLAPARVAEIAADWPCYWVGRAARPDGTQRLLEVPDSNCCALFTTKDALEAYVRAQREIGLVDAAFESVAMPHRRGRSALHMAAQHCQNAWIDPAPLGVSGVPLPKALVDAALSRIDERLTPRLPEIAT
jgi:hypothetical protein